MLKLFVEHVVCRHGVPEELLSDRGTNFLSDLIIGVCEILGVKKINTSGYHPQTDGLVEKFNSTLISMIAKCCEVNQHDWDNHLPFLLCLSVLYTRVHQRVTLFLSLWKGSSSTNGDCS